MSSNKNRLYVALYLREAEPKMPGLEDKYHWAFIIGPKSGKKGGDGRRIHATDSLAPNPNNGNNWEHFWRVEDRPVPLMPTSMLLTRVVIAKIKDEEGLRALFKSIPVRPEQMDWNCIVWMKEALETAWANGTVLGTTVNGGWQEVRDQAMWYVEEKKAAHRFDGAGNFNLKKTAPPPTWDALERAEMSP